ncbi:MAG: CPBP family intramembrane metalloprotease [Candidatus Cloacimonetes bacterium]|jgi:membrane protease YdiL (CAAX protease family)|nr:CPBP family intramembrane metalloprotease [Candidatus Cloacimonadota bacterium]MBT4333704.1 CPBP family intramembrane metalloprotease [Candidatus Cloacimonadota bacterium]
MKKFKEIFQKRPVLMFWILAILLATALIPIALIIFTKFPDFGKDIDIVTDGKGYNTNILFSLPIALKVSGGAWFAFILLAWPATASVSGIISSFILKQKVGVIELFKKFRFWAPELPFKKGLSIWLQAILLTVGINVVFSILRNYISDVEPQEFFKINTVYTIWEIFFIFVTSLFFDGGGLMEEIGWRGFALPRLQMKFTPLQSSIILGIIWSLWHVPIKIDILFSSPSYFLSFYFIFTLVCILYCIVITYFYNRLGGSILIGVAFHGLMNDSTGLKTIFNADSLVINDFVDTGLIAIIFMVVVFAILYKEGPMLGKRETKLL